MPKRYTVRELLRILAADGWYLAGQKGSHRQLRHPTKPGRVTVAGQPADVPPPKTVRSILHQAGLDPKNLA